ncbi:Glycosyltransferase involved in cell wall bisynthesis [Geosporobacter subterraneus DSM 17957]|uniref:Glycosyltransferase involved in cell wall bisynthesis n=1 Tax=Geosporobacter subterraneus DSM 17957 TaxID=1121919 RepID=A0A1M6BUZ0_9FIRM|nr:glycosyltransferase family 4 protein [Geosporobacter subterraneus]SHI52575.1 Glycosyltransferase involved in cell wall bisynthesis [Geosporobacter subterraneus DSM 17957]
MRVLFFVRKDLVENPAGDTTIICALKKQLGRYKITADICMDHRINLNTYDVIHLFNVSRASELYNFMNHISIRDKAVALTPIYWDLSEYLKTTNQISKLDTWINGEKKRKHIFDHVDLSILHCKGEANLIKQNFNYKKLYKIIPYGTNIASAETSNYIRNKYGFNQYVLCVGRISYQKNQLNLIRALKKDSIPIVFVGSINDQEYYKLCRTEAGEKTIFINKMDHQQVLNLYHHAHVHILPSWLEYPGLANLEAGAAGCNIVSTEIGSAKEVFKNMINYCHPNNLESIRSSTLMALETPKSDLLRTYILEHYSWEHHAQELQQQYLNLLDYKKMKI